MSLNGALLAGRKGFGAWIWLGMKWILLLVFLWETFIFAQVLWWRTHNPDQTSFMRARAASLQSQRRPPLFPHPWVPYQGIPNTLKQAVVAAEDSHFMAHHGFDWEGIRQAYQRDLKHHRFVAGGSTLTQQLAKNLFLSEQRSLWRKGQEALITVMLEATWSKRRILEVYLNTIEWGDGIFGCAAAAQHYFHEPVRDLTPAQSARLASMISRPRFYEGHGNSLRLQDKIDRIENRRSQVAIPD